MLAFKQNWGCKQEEWVIVIFFILIILKIKMQLILDTKFQPSIPIHFGEMDLNARVDVNFFMVDVNFHMAIIT